MTLNVNVRGHGGVAGCTRWFLRFNGQECHNPVTMEMIDYRNSDGNLHRNMESEQIKY